MDRSISYPVNRVNYVARAATGAPAWYTTFSTISQGGWSNSVPIRSAQQVSWSTTDAFGHHIACHGWVNYVFQDARGNRHNLDLSVYSDPLGTGPCSYNTTDQPYGFDGIVATTGGEGPILATTTDQTGQTTTGTLKVTDGDGTLITFSSALGTYAMAASLTDRNGNFVTIHPPVYPSNAFNYVDSVGRTVLQDTGFGISPETVTVSGLGAPYNLTWTTLSTPSFSTPITTISGTCGAPTHTGGWLNFYGTAVKGISTLSLPNTKNFTFAYDSTYGLINKVTYPTGGYVRYVWGMDAQAETATCINPTTHVATGTILFGTPAVVDRYVSFDGTTEVLHQHFAYANTWTSSPGEHWTGKTTTVTTTDNVRGTSFNTVYNYSSVAGDIPPNTAPPYYTGTPQIPVESIITYKDTNGATLKTVAKTWQNERLLKSVTTAFQNGQTSETTYNYDSNEMQIEQDDYDFGVNAPGPLLRKVVTTYAAFGTQHIVDKPSAVQTFDSTGTTLIAETDSSYDQTARTATSGVVQHTTGSNFGNLTTRTESVIGSGTTLTTTYAYDDTGQVISMTDPCGNTACSDMTGSNHVTSYSYSDNYTILSGGQNVSFTPTGNTNAFVTQTTNPLGHLSNFTYDFNNGQLTGAKNQNDISGSLSGGAYVYNDALARPMTFQYSDGGQTSFSYNDAAYNQVNNTPSTQRTQLIVAGSNIAHTTAMDGLRHTARALLISDPVGTDTGDVTYDGAGRTRTKTNAHRSGSFSTDGTTTYNYDALGRSTSVVQADGSTSTTTYSGNCSTVTDEAIKVRKSCSDALGRLTQVFEDPNTLNYETDYAYDALGNLLTVNQKGGDPNSANWRMRTFTYDSVSRLLTAHNPESGTLTYTYDANGNINTKKDANGTTITYGYDVQNRLTGKTYSNGDGAITYSYDAFASGTNFGIGYRTGMTDSSGSTTWTYDTMGRVWSEKRIIGSVNKTISTQYNLDGSVKQITYPSGTVLIYSYDSAAELTQVKDTTNNITYFQNASYFPTGELNQATYGSVVETSIYNNRLQPCWYYATTGTPLGASTACSGSATPANVLDLKYNFGFGTNDSGNVWSETNDKDSNRSVTYTYDALNRVASAATPNTDCSTLASGITKNWGETFTIDPWGNLTNRTVTKCSADTLSVVALSNNRLSGFGYNADGNMTSNGSATYTYTAESRLKTAGGVTYTYNGDGERVKKSNGTLYWGSGPLLESDLSGNLLREFIFANGRRIARRDISGGGVYYYFSDNLGSADVVTNSSGAIQNESDYFPYGGERVYSQALTSQNYKFTGKERDAESNLDMFGARYYGSSLGRFMTPDWSNILYPVPYASVDDPQTLNLYSYVRNNPTTLIDPDGHCWKGFQHLCNLVTGYGWRSDVQVEQAIHEARKWLRENTYFSAAQQEGLNGKQAFALYNGFQNHDKTVVSDGKKWTLQFVSVLPGVIPPKLYRGGTNMEGRPNVDLRIDKETGLVKPGRGISLNAESGGLEQFGGANEIDQSSVPSELEIKQLGKPGHYELAPREPMTVDRYNELAGQVKFK